jgi:signal transduction histidine kinase
VLVDVGGVLRGVADLARAGAQEQGVTLQTEVESGLPRSVADPDRLRQIIGNLVDNSLRYTPQGGTICLRARTVDGGRVRLEVQDSGSGIAAEDRARVFDRFYRGDRARARTDGGSGLGLAIVRALVEAHGGLVWVQSEPGQGSTFTVELP